jgi:REP element-mobilizing transposase RayT
MPDHVHWLFALRRCELAMCVQLFKGRTARRVHAMRRDRGPFWQAGYFDHAIRDTHGLQRHARYILENPVRAGLVIEADTYPHRWCVWGNAVDA